MRDQLICIAFFVLGAALGTGFWGRLDRSTRTKHREFDNENFHNH